jgi:uncharacterized peroxidase-related enzyme
MYGKSPLSREQREMIGVIVSTVNKCEYCIQHHAAALNHYWKDEEKVKQLTRDYKKADIEDNDRGLCELAALSTSTPYSNKISGLIKKLKKEGQFSDRSILDANMVIAYFNFVNRIVFNLEVEIEKDPSGYKY